MKACEAIGQRTYMHNLQTQKTSGDGQREGRRGHGGGRQRMGWGRQT